jgi:hypothetical protein
VPHARALTARWSGIWNRRIHDAKSLSEGMWVRVSHTEGIVEANMQYKCRKTNEQTLAGWSGTSLNCIRGSGRSVTLFLLLLSWRASPGVDEPVGDLKIVSYDP